MGPCFSSVSGLVNAIAHGEIGAMQAFATAHVNDIGVGRSYGNGPNGLRGLMVENGVPGASRVFRFPDATVHLANIEDIGLARDTGGCSRAPTPERSNHAPTHFLVHAFRKMLRRCDAHPGKPENASRYHQHETPNSFHMGLRWNIQGGTS